MQFKRVITFCLETAGPLSTPLSRCLQAAVTEWQALNWRRQLVCILILSLDADGRRWPAGLQRQQSNHETPTDRSSATC